MYTGNPGAWRSDSPTIEFPPVQDGHTAAFVPVKLPSNHPLAPRVPASQQILAGFATLKPTITAGSIWHFLGRVLIFLLKCLFWIVIVLSFAIFFHFVWLLLAGDKDQPAPFRPGVQT